MDILQWLTATGVGELVFTMLVSMVPVIELRGGGDVRAAMIIDLTPLWFVALPLAALFGLVFKWGIFWVYVGIIMEQISKFWVGVSRFRSRAWINDVTNLGAQ